MKKAVKSVTVKYENTEAGMSENLKNKNEKRWSHNEVYFCS